MTKDELFVWRTIGVAAVVATVGILLANQHICFAAVGSFAVLMLVIGVPQVLSDASKRMRQDDIRKDREDWRAYRRALKGPKPPAQPPQPRTMEEARRRLNEERRAFDKRRAKERAAWQKEKPQDWS